MSTTEKEKHYRSLRYISARVRARMERVAETAMAAFPKGRMRLPVNVMVRPRPDAAHKVPSIKINAINSNFRDNRITTEVAITDIPYVLAPKDRQLPPQTLEAVSDWILLNRQVLLDYWFGKLWDTTELVEKLQPLP